MLPYGKIFAARIDAAYQRGRADGYKQAIEELTHDDRNTHLRSRTDPVGSVDNRSDGTASSEIDGGFDLEDPNPTGC
jgi:hypothetical protein